MKRGLVDKRIFLKIIFLASSLAQIESSEINLSQYFNLPICCYGGSAILPDSNTAYSTRKEFNLTGPSIPITSKIGFYKRTVPFNSTENKLKKSKRSTGSNSGEVIELKLDKVEPQVLVKAEIRFPPNWQEQLRHALYDQMVINSGEKFKNLESSSTLNPKLWKDLEAAPFEIIDPVTRTISTIQDQPDLSTNFSGIMVNTKSGLEIRTASSSFSPQTINLGGSCDCPLIQHGDMLLAYWSVNSRLLDNGESELEYQIYPVPHNVPTPPNFIPFIPDLEFKPSPIDFNAADESNKIHNFEEVHATKRHLRGYNENPDAPYVNLGYPPIFHAKVNPPIDIANGIFPGGYTPGFLDWYRSILDKQFRLDDLLAHLHTLPPPPPPPIHPPPPLPTGIAHPIPIYFPPGQHLPPIYPPLPDNRISPEQAQGEINGGVHGGLPLPPPIPPGQYPPGQYPPVQYNPNILQDFNNHVDGGIPPELRPGEESPNSIPPGNQMNFPLPLPPNYPPFIHPNSIQEIISGRPPLSANDEIEMNRNRRKINGDCQDTNTKNTNCKSSIAISKYPSRDSRRESNTVIRRSENTQRSETVVTKSPPNSRESGYILNF